MASLIDTVRSALGLAAKPTTPAPYTRELALADPLRLFGPDDFPPYNPSELVTRKGLEIFDTMMADDQIKAALTFRRQAVIAAGWQVDSPPDRPEDWEVSEFIRHVFAEMQSTVDRVLFNVLSAMAYGYSVTEKVYKVMPRGPFSGLVGIDTLKTRRPHEFRFQTDPFGNITTNGIIQEVAGAKPVELPRDKFILFTNADTFANPYGHSELEAAYRPWWISENAHKWLAMMLERFGIPPVGAIYNPQQFTPSQLTQLQKALENLQAATSFLIPRSNKEGLELWAPELAGQVSGVFIPTLEMLDRAKARALLMPGLLGVTPDQLGSMARARVTFDMFLLSVGFTQEVIADQVMTEQVIRPLVALNFGITETPVFRFKELTDESQQGLMKTWTELITTRAVQPGPEDEEFIRALLDFPQGKPVEERTGLQPSDISPMLVESGALTINEIRRAHRLPPIKGGDGLTAPQITGGLNNARMRRAGAEAATVPPAAAQDARAPGDGKEEPAETVKQATMAQDEPRGPIDLSKLPWAARVIDFTAIDAMLERREREFLEEGASLLASAWRKTRDGALPYRLADLDLDWTFPVPERFATGLVRLMRANFADGRRDLRREIATLREVPATLAEDDGAEVNFEPVTAIAWMETKAEFTVKGLSRAMSQIVLGEIIEGLREGLPYRETAHRIDAALEPYLGGPGAVPFHRLETIVRTVATDAYNHGRLIEARKLGSFLVPAMVYVAVLDPATTDICRHLDGKIFHLDDPNLDRFCPANHFRCRSILAGMPIGMEPGPEGFITPEELAEAARLADPRFGGDPRAKKGNRPNK